VNQLRFDSGLGCYSVSAAPDSVWISKGMGTHCLQVRLQVGIPEVGESAGRLLLLETVLAAPDTGHGPRMPLACANVALAFNSDGEIRPPTLQYLITNAQLHALEQQRNGDLRLELQVAGFLPQADPGLFPGAPPVTEHITIAESRWRQQLSNLGRTLGVDMVIPFPEGDEPREAAGRFLREAQQLLAGNDIGAVMLQARKALETIGKASSWRRPPSKAAKDDWTAEQRWALIRAALEDQASGNMHVGPGTKDHKYTRDEAEALISMTAVLLRIMP
jgi:hypothetical protein